MISALEAFVDWSEANASRLGYFAALYLRITEAVEAALEQGDVFHNNALLAQLDVTFANRYLAALNAWFHPQDFPPISACWARAFAAAGSSGDTIVQHLLAGVSSHIGLDLGVATQEVCGGKPQLEAFKGDFDKINALLGAQVQTVVDEIDAESPILTDLYRLLGKHELQLIDDALGGTRTVAWALAVTLTDEPPELRPATIAVQNGVVADMVTALMTPPQPLEAIAQWIASVENQDVAAVIAELRPA